MRLSQIALLFLPCALSQAQTPQPLRFDVASVKQQKWTLPATVGLNVEGNTLHGEHQRLDDLIVFAYGLRGRFEVSGGPGWATHGGLADSPDLYQLLAKPAPGQTPTMDEYRLMLQTLLADRFHLRVHHENRQLPVYDLVVSKGGEKMKDTAGGKTGIEQHNIGRVGMRLVATNVTIKEAAAGLLGLYSRRPVFDKTGLTGHYDFTLEWILDPTNADAGASGSDLPTYGTAVQEQLGLRLESTTAPYDTIVIDSAEKPTEN